MGDTSVPLAGEFVTASPTVSETCKSEIQETIQNMTSHDR